MPMRRLVYALVLVLGSTLPAHADPAADGTRIRLPESMSLTPDGRTLVLSWRGDLWRVAATGGSAQRLTYHPANDVRPHISPDGTQVAFLSNRSGAEQVHVMPLAGGRPRQVTLHTEGARLYGWFPDSKAVLIRSRRDHHWRAAERYYRKPLDLMAAPTLLFDDHGGVAAVSPSGRYLAFTREGMGWIRKGYRGPKASQLWIYDLEQASFRKLSQGEHGESWPLWGADEHTLYFVSEESGTWNLWKTDPLSGDRSQVTFLKDDGVSFPTISADGSTIVYRRLFDLQRLSATAGGKSVEVFAYDNGDSTIERIDHRTLTKATAVAFSDDAREIAFIAGGDVWVMDTELREPRRITNTPAEERDPVFSPDFKTISFVSDALGQSDIWQVRRSDEALYWWQNETFKAARLTKDEASESDLRFTPNGKRLAYLRGQGELWTMNADGTSARKIAQSFSGLQFSFSPDGQYVAYSKSDDDFNWDVWIAPTDGSKEPVNVSMHPDNDRNPVWSPDGKLLAFTGRRWDDESDICYVWLGKQDDETAVRDRTLTKALKKMKGRGKKGPKAAPGARTPKAGKAPAGKAPAKVGRGPLAGRWSGRLAGPQPLPKDGLDLILTLVRGTDGSYTCTLEVVGQFSGAADNLTFDPASGGFSFDMTTPLGALSGKGVVQGERMQGTWAIGDVMSGTFEATREAAAEEAPTEKAGKESPAKATSKKPTPKKERLAIDLEGINDRIRRVSIRDAEEYGLFWSPDSKKLAFRAAIKGARGLYTIEFPDKLTPKLLTTTSGSSARWLKAGKQIAWLAAGQPAILTATGKPTSYRFSVRQSVDLGALYGAAFDQAWRVMRDRYYDPRLGNRDWKAVRAKYSPMAHECLRAGDLSLVVNMMLGELNGSHLGFRATRRAWSHAGWHDVTGHLGARFDRAFEGPGLKVKDVIEGTPAFESRHRLKAGDVVLAIDEQEVGPQSNWAALMTGDPSRRVELRVKSAEGEERTLRMPLTSLASVRRRLYDHWVRQTRTAVAKASDGRLGYLHVRGMNWSSFLRFEAELYKVGHGKDGLIIDVRDNGGGFTTDHLLTCLTQPRHALTRPRGGGVGYPNDRTVYASWNKPIVVLCNQNSFSNAEIFAHAIKTLGRGPIVGVTTAGGVISTGGTGIMGFASLRLPFRGWYLLESGEDMELNGCVPDHVIWPEPGDHGRGHDRQLDKAIAVGLEEVRTWQKRPQAELKPASSR